MIAENSRQYLIKNQASPLSFYDKVLPEMSETLGQLIQRRMKDLGIPSKAELARRLGISSAYAGDLANDTGKTKDGIYTPGSELIAKLSKVLEVTEIEILTAIGLTSGENIIPESLSVIDYSEFDEDDIRDIAEYIEFRRQQKIRSKKTKDKNYSVHDEFDLAKEKSRTKK